jgi:hypothetical protein
MEEFNLERALSGEPVCTRDGRDVTQLIRFKCEEKMKLFGVLDEGVHYWNDDGSWKVDSDTNNKDLFMKPKENAIWVNVHSKDSRIWIVEGDDDGFKTEQEAKRYSFGDIYYIKTLRITDNRDTI